MGLCSAITLVVNINGGSAIIYAPQQGLVEKSRTGLTLKITIESAPLFSPNPRWGLFALQMY